MKLLRTLAVAATLALVACGDENAVALNEPPVSSQDVSSQEDSSSSSDVIETSSCSETVVTSSSSQTPSTEISNGSTNTLHRNIKRFNHHRWTSHRFTRWQDVQDNRHREPSVDG